VTTVGDWLDRDMSQVLYVYTHSIFLVVCMYRHELSEIYIERESVGGPIYEIYIYIVMS
jgi:hypothetical protein